jgi:hypothetical protein
MATDLNDPDLIEDDRSRRASELAAGLGPGWEDPFKPGTPGCHGLLDRTSWIADLVEQAIIDHPACVQDPEWHALAGRAAASLHELYQRIGERHLDGSEGDNRT